MVKLVVDGCAEFGGEYVDEIEEVILDEGVGEEQNCVASADDTPFDETDDPTPRAMLEFTDVLLGDTTLFHLANEPVTSGAVSGFSWSADLLRIASRFRLLKGR